MSIKKYLFFVFFLLAKFSFGQSFTSYYPKMDQFVSGEVNFAWNSLDSAMQYQLKIAADNQVLNPIVNQVLTQNQQELSGLLNGRYYWKVLAYRNGSPFDSTAIGRFNVFNVNELDSVNLWLRSDTGLVLNGSTLASWNDVSASGLNLNQPTAARQPLFNPSVLNGYPGLFFDGVNDYFDFPINLTGPNYSFASVYNTRTPTGLIRLFNGSNSWFYGPYAGNHTAFSGGFTQGKSVDSARFVVQSIRVANDQLYNFVNDSLYGQKAASTRPGISLRMGSFLSGYINEIVIVNGTIADSTRSKLDQYLLDKYAPPVNLGPDQLVCSFPLNLNAANDYLETYLWSNGSTSPSISVNASGTYSLRTQDIFGRISRDTVYVLKDTVNYVATLPADTTLCLGDSLRIEVQGSDLYSYNWSTGESGKAISVFSSGWYVLSVTNCNGLLTEDSILVQFNEPAFSLGANQQICFYDSLSLSPDSSFSGVTYLWSTGSAASSIEVSNSGIYSLRVTDNFSCSFSDSLQVFSDSTLFGISLGSDTALCAGNSLGLVNPLPFIDSYLWSTGSSDSSTFVSTSQDYSLTLTESGCMASDTVSISVKGQAPAVGFSSMNLCFADSVQFTDTSLASGGINLKNWSWDFGDGVFSSLQNPKHRFASSGLYSVKLEVENDSGCIGLALIPTRIFPLPAANFGFNLSCETDSTQFFDSSSISIGSIQKYSWDFGNSAVIDDTSGLQNPAYIFPSQGVYAVSLRIESNESCIDTLTKLVDVKAKPLANFSASSFYIGDSTEFTNLSSISSGTINNLQWSFGDGNFSNLPNPKNLYSSKGTYFVNLTASSNFGCTDQFQDSLTITDPPPPAPEFNTVYPKWQQVLAGEVAFMWNKRDSARFYKLEVASDSDFSTMLFSQSPIARNFTQRQFNDGHYYWRVIALLDSQRRDTSNTAAFRIFNPKSLNNLNLWIKSDSGVVLTNGLVSAWTDLSDSALQLIQPAVARQALLQNEVINGYPGVYFDGVNDLFNFNIDLSQPDFSISSVYNTRTKSGLISFIRGSNNWFLGPYAGKHVAFSGGFTDGELVDSARFAVHRVSAKSDTLYNNVNGLLFGSRPASNRPGTSLTLGSFLSGHVLETIVVQGNLSDSLKDLSDSYLMDKYAPPVDLGPDIRSCSFPMQFQKDLDYAVSYSWSTGSNSSQTTIDSAGKYYLSIVDQFNRQSTDSIFFILDTSNYQVDLGFEDSTICLGSSIELLAGDSIYSFSWNTSDSSYSIQTDSAAVYTVSVLNCQGNTSFDTVEVLVNNPKFSLGRDTSICFNRNIVLSADSNFNQVNFLWSTGSTDSTILTNLQEQYSLQVTDSFGCQFSDTLNLSVDSSLAVLDLGPDTSLCTGNVLGLQVPIPGITAYNWSNGYIGPSLPVDSAGTYGIEVLKNGCAARDTVVLTIQGEAPFANFSIQNSCFLDSMLFSDLSVPASGDTLVSWLWKFGDGDSSTSVKPLHQYPAVNSYTVLLKVITNKGCVDTVQQTLDIYPKPQASFQSNNHCSKQNLNFFDRSTISAGSVVAYTWDFGDSASASNSSILRKPSHVYDTLGLYTVRLISESDQGCRDTSYQVTVVNPSPIISYTYSGMCLGDSTKITNLTSLAAGSIFDYRWVINDNFISLNRDPVLKIQNAGQIPLALRVRSDSLCSNQVYDTIAIYHKPIADFIAGNYCLDQPFTVQGNSSIVEDSIVNYQYVFNQTDSSFLQDPSFISSQNGSFPLSLKVESNNACLDSISKNIFVSELPKPNFSIRNNNTGIPFKVELINSSTGANSYVWDFGNGDQDAAFEPNYSYVDTGLFQIQLKAINSFGCADSTFKMARARPYFLDASVGKIFLSESPEGYLKISLQLINSGYNTIHEMSLVASINDRFNVQELFQEDIYSGEQSAYEFVSSFIQSSNDKADFVCVQILSVNQSKDQNENNNEVCEEGFGQELFLDFYPNPTRNQLSINYVLPDRGEVNLQFYDQWGRRVLKEFNQTQEAGVYTLVYDVSGLKSGLYHYQFSYNGNSRSNSIIKQ